MMGTLSNGSLQIGDPLKYPYVSKRETSEPHPCGQTAKGRHGLPPMCRKLSSYRSRNCGNRRGCLRPIRSASLRHIGPTTATLAAKGS